jgi:hypothetical protein
MSDIAKGIRECLDKINELRGQNATQAARVAELEKALITAQNMLSEIGISSAEKCQMAYDYLREANAALGGKDE